MPAAAHSEKKLAVVDSKFDRVEIVLRNMELEFDLIRQKDLEDPVTFTRYRAVYFPCGIDEPIEQKLSVLAQRASIKSVALKPDYYEPDRKKISSNIKQFIEDGGSAYFSDYSYEYLQEAFDIFRFFDDFPYMGMTGRIEARVMGDMPRFSLKSKMAFYFTHPGWIAVKSAGDSEILSEGEFDTPRGRKKGPISVIIKRGRGEAIYTSYHSTVYSEFRRFNICRIAGRFLITRAENLAKKWGQDITARIADSITEGETHRIHYLPVRKGNNSIYLVSENYPHQIDVFDARMSLIESRDERKKSSLLDFSSDDDYCYVKIYPSSSKRFGMYAIVSASGSRLFPYLYRIIFGIGAAVITGGIVWFIIFSPGRRKYRGRFHLKK
jgi:hypothetical protein